MTNDYDELPATAITYGCQPLAQGLAHKKEEGSAMRKAVEKYGEWAVRTEVQFVNIQRGTQGFYECRATHPIYGDTTPARSVDEETAFRETLKRIKWIENNSGCDTGRTVTYSEPLFSASSDGESKVDPLVAEFGHNLRRLTSTRRVENAWANHRCEPWRRPKGRVVRRYACKD
jgi:hypothetical protein